MRFATDAHGRGSATSGLYSIYGIVARRPFPRLRSNVAAAPAHRGGRRGAETSLKAPSISSSPLVPNAGAYSKAPKAHGLCRTWMIPIVVVVAWPAWCAWCQQQISSNTDSAYEGQKVTTLELDSNPKISPEPFRTLVQQKAG